MSGLLVVDTIAYQRVDEATISGVGKKDGCVVLQEIARVESDRLQLEFRIGADDHTAIRNLAVFERD